MITSNGISRTNAAIVGILFIIGTATGIVAAMIGKTILDAPDYLAGISTHASQVIPCLFNPL